MTYEEFVILMTKYINESNGKLRLNTLGGNSQFEVSLNLKNENEPQSFHLDNLKKCEGNFSAADYYRVRIHYINLPAEARYHGRNYTQCYFEPTKRLSTQLVSLIPAIFKFLTINNHPVF